MKTAMRIHPVEFDLKQAFPKDQAALPAHPRRHSEGPYKDQARGVRHKSRIVNWLCREEPPKNAPNVCKFRIANMLRRKRRLSAIFGETGLASKKRTQKLCNSLVSSLGFRSQWAI